MANSSTSGITRLPSKLIYTILLGLVQVLPLSATPISTLDGRVGTLASVIQSPHSLLLIVSEPAELSEAQRLLTLAEAEQQHALIALIIPDDTWQSIKIRNAARSYFKSDYSREHIIYLHAADNPFADSKTVLISPGEPKPIYQASSFPTNELPTQALIVD